MISPIISFHWLGLDNRIKTTYDRDLVVANGYPYVIKVTEDLNPHTSIVIIHLPKENNNIMDIIVCPDDKDKTNEINFMLRAFINLAQKKGK